jgi:hypothetical protein
MSIFLNIKVPNKVPNKVPRVDWNKPLNRCRSKQELGTTLPRAFEAIALITQPTRLKNEREKEGG